MTLQELYTAIDGDYEQAIKVLRIDKLIDKHIRKLPSNSIFAELADAGRAMDETRIFESAHAIKGVCSNLGLVKIAALASEVCDDFRPGNARRFSDEQVKAKLAEIDVLYNKAVEGIGKYAEG